MIADLRKRAQAVATLMECGYQYFERADGSLVRLGDLIARNVDDAPRLDATAEAYVKCLGEEPAHKSA